MVFFEEADESVLEIRGACVKAVIRDIDGCEKGDCSFLGYSYAKASNASSSCTIGEESSVVQSCCSSCRAKGAGWCFCDCPVEERDSYLPASYQLVQCWFSLQTVPPVAGKDLPPRKERKIKRTKKGGVEWGGQWQTGHDRKKTRMKRKDPCCIYWRGQYPALSLTACRSLEQVLPRPRCQEIPRFHVKSCDLQGRTHGLVCWKWSMA